MTMLLEPKFFLPRSRQKIVVRPRLLDQLNAGLHRKVILVLAQAGFGKTTLVADWLNTLIQQDTIDNSIHHSGSSGNNGSCDDNSSDGSNRSSISSPSPVRVAWISLDENDNDPLRFFDYLLTALQRADASVGQHARSLLSAPQPPTNLEPLTISLINDLAALSSHLFLALDDYHTITSQEVHHIIHELISHAPDHFHLVIASRTEPPLPLTRWRIYRELVEVRENDLRFTLDEAMTYLLETMRCTISSADVAALEQRTEGWIVGLHLAALSLQGRPDTSAFIADFTGSHAYIVDYLTEEVLQQQQPEIQEFLFQTSLLARFCAPLCDAVLERSGSQQILESLERSHLFVIPLDNERGWYRYHHLFAEMLRRRAQEYDAVQRKEAYRRAAQWFAQKELWQEAVEYALAAIDSREPHNEESRIAADMIERSLPSLVASGHFVLLTQWLNRLPPAMLRSRPLLCATRARTAMRRQQLDEAEQWLEFTWKALAAHPIQDPQVVGEAHAIRVDLALNRGQIAETIRLANESLANLAEDLLRPRSEILFYLGIAYFWDVQYAQAVSANRQAAQLATDAGNVGIALYAWFNHARYSHTQGKLHEAKTALAQAWDDAFAANVHQLPLMVSYYNNRGELFYEWNMLDAAEESFLQGSHLAEQGHNPRSLLRSQSLLLPVYIAKGQHAKADETMQQALRLARQHQLPIHILDECTWFFVGKWLVDGNMAAIAEWIESRGLPIDTPIIRGLESEYYLIARYLVAQGDLEKAMTLLEGAAESAFAVDKMLIYLQVVAYRSLLLYQMGDRHTALDLLAQALKLAEPQGFIRTFLDQGPEMRIILAALQPSVIPTLQSYIGRLLDAFGQMPETGLEPSVPTLPTPASHTDLILIEKLSERELEVLRLVDGGLSDRQIAQQLILATGTVKRHLNNIYGKLGVHNRTHALARARALHLL